MLIFKLSILFTLGVILSTIMNKARIPDVLAYIAAGIILGPSLLNLFNYDDVVSLDMINQFALCMVGFLVSKTLNIKMLKETNFTVIYISVIESFVTFLIVFFTCYVICRQSVQFSLLLGAISSATAPIIPLMVLRQFKAKGDLSSSIVPVIAIDDIVCIFLFYFALAWAKVGISEGTFGSLLFHYFSGLFITIVAGTVIGLAFSFLFNCILKSAEEHLIFSVGICFACVGIAQVLNLQPTILSMTIGFIMANCTKDNEKIFDRLYNFAPPVFLAFFVATSSIIVIDIYYIINIGVIGIAYILSRTLGKLAGCYIGSVIFKYTDITKKYLGVSILAQAGIILVMSDIVKNEIPNIGEQIDIIVRGGCVIFFIIGPILTKFSIGKAKEINY